VVDLEVVEVDSEALVADLEVVEVEKEELVVESEASEVDLAEDTEVDGDGNTAHPTTSSTTELPTSTPETTRTHGKSERDISPRVPTPFSNLTVSSELSNTTSTPREDSKPKSLTRDGLTTEREESEVVLEVESVDFKKLPLQLKIAIA
jgi:hypothetical protein